MANEAQTQLWNDANAKRWAELRRTLGPMLSPFGEAALKALAPRAGESVLDVGCGFGDTTVELARLTGAALGVDISQPMLEVARREAVPGARYLVADAQTHAFEPEFDLLYSRFGVMFFDDPAAAFANLRRALRPGGRLAFAVWGPFEENDWASVPLRALRKHLPGPSSPSRAPGPFALSDAARLESLLSGAGFEQVALERVEVARRTEPSVLLRSGPVAAALNEAGQAADHLRPALEAEIAAALPDGIHAVGLIATARAAGSR